MSNGINYLHSHSGIERDQKFKKDVVLVDEKYKDMFSGEPTIPYGYKKKTYIMVNTYSFARKGGVFKNLYE